MRSGTVRCQVSIVHCRDYERSALIHDREGTKTYTKRPELWRAGIGNSAHREVFGISRLEGLPHPKACGSEWAEQFLGWPRANRGRRRSPMDESRRAQPMYQVQGFRSYPQPSLEAGRSECDDASQQQQLSS